MVESCYKHSGIYVHPIIDWSRDDVWEFIRQQELDYCCLYDEGFHRLGCVLCPMSRNYEIEMARWPQIAKAYKNTLEKLLVVRKAEGKTTTFKTGQEFFDWWVQRSKSKKIPEGQLRLFD